MRWILPALVLALAACDPGASTAPALDTAASLTAAPILDGRIGASSSESPYAVTETIQMRDVGDGILLTVDGVEVILSAGEAYLTGQALSRAGYETLPPELAEQLRPRKPGKPGPRCEVRLETLDGLSGAPPVGSAVVLIDDRFVGPGGCPPPPPPMFMPPDFLGGLLDGAPAEIVEVPEGVQWIDVPGGFVGVHPGDLPRGDWPGTHPLR